MEINIRILEIFEEVKIHKADGICYLLSLFYGYEPSYIPDYIKIKMNMTKIYTNLDGNLHWNVPLFEGQTTAFDWVKTEYAPLFKEANPDRGGKIRESVARMKKLFAKNPDVRKEDVIGATKMYLFNTDYNYIRFPHYFIEKGVGADKTSDLLDWVEKYKLSQTIGEGRVTNRNTIK